MLKLRFKNSGSLHAKTTDPACLQAETTMLTNEEDKFTGSILAQTGSYAGDQYSKREKKLVEMLRESEQRFRTTLAYEQKARTEAEARVSQLNEFLGIVSHELRTPLTATKGNIQLALLHLKKVEEEIGPVEGVTSKLESVQVLLERADRQIGIQNRLVGDLLDVSRIQANKLDFRLEPCNLVDIVREAIHDQQQAAPLRTICLDVACEGTVPVVADSDRIGQVVTNYLTNALKYSEFDRPVEVSLQSDGHVALVLVRDEGPGLSDTEQQRIWERFYRVEGIPIQSGAGISLGLGLYICKTIIEYHQGQVGVQSIPGQGSTFWFTLPVAA
jgi:signal transduction histidine kinase